MGRKGVHLPLSATINCERIAILGSRVSAVCNARLSVGTCAGRNFLSVILFF